MEKKKFFIIYLKKKYRVPKQFKNEFSALSAIEAIPMIGGSECLISKQRFVMNKTPIQKHAYRLYNEMKDLSPFVRVGTSCGVLNCVKREHLEPKFVPFKKDIKNILDEVRFNGEEHVAHHMNVPLNLFKEWLSTQLLS